MKRKSLESPNGESNKPKIQHEEIPRVKTKPNSTQKQRQLVAFFGGFLLMPPRRRPSATFQINE
jgi:hypothetical protein